ncbi:hypothetical protein RN001_005785 [Aquatica leii]|uniref:SWIM-type domain-containing protein n=1 Tax=Aquatica leii TaxID=1421715 RepID=A0AAN7SAT3_9COLE|nr:hypothetical protein RN001_005785 [Aquatica leii]
MDLLAFTREVPRFYLKNFKKSIRPARSVTQDLKFSDGGHYPGKLEKQLRYKCFINKIMTTKHILSVTMIANYFKDNLSLLHRGENSYSSGNVNKTVYEPNMQPPLLKGEVKASVKNRTYNVEMLLDVNEGILEGTCTCPRGQVLCHHMAAVCFHAHYNISVTDIACAWSAPRPSTSEDVRKLKDMFPEKKIYNPLKKNISSESIDNFKKEVSSLMIGYSWLLRETPQQASQNVVDIENILLSKEYSTAQDKEVFLNMMCKMEWDAIKQVVLLTIGQATNEHWLIAKRHRLTSSKFGIVLSACSKNKYPKSLFISLLDGYDLNGVQAVQWGRHHEAVAVATFEAATVVWTPSECEITEIYKDEEWNSNISTLKEFYLTKFIPFLCGQ